MSTSTVDSASLQKIQDGEYMYVDGTKKTNLFAVVKNMTTQAGSCVMYLTDDGTANGNPLFSEIEEVRIAVNDSSSMYGKSYSISNDLITLTATITKQTFNTTSVLGILSFTSVTFPQAPNGTTVKVIAIGK